MHEPQRAERLAHGVDRHRGPRQTAVQGAVVTGLDPGLADDLARFRGAVAALLELGGADLAEETQELAAERPLRVGALRQRRDVHARKVPCVLVEVERDRLGQPRQHDGRGVRRADEPMPDPAYERGHRDAAETAVPGHLLEPDEHLPPLRGWAATHRAGRDGRAPWPRRSRRAAR